MLTCIDKSSSTAGTHGAYYGANKRSNLGVTRKSYMEKTKTITHKNKAMKAAKHLAKGQVTKFSIHKKQDN